MKVYEMFRQGLKHSRVRDNDCVLLVYIIVKYDSGMWYCNEEALCRIWTWMFDGQY